MAIKFSPLPEDKSWPSPAWTPPDKKEQTEALVRLVWPGVIEVSTDGGATWVTIADLEAQLKKLQTGPE